jgi:hypothetical protein
VRHGSHVTTLTMSHSGSHIPVGVLISVGVALQPTLTGAHAVEVGARPPVPRRRSGVSSGSDSAARSILDIGDRQLGQPMGHELAGQVGVGRMLLAAKLVTIVRVTARRSASGHRRPPPEGPKSVRAPEADGMRQGFHTAL